MIVLDSSAVVALFKGRADGERVRDHIMNESVALSSITLHEVMVGLDGRDATAFDTFLGNVHLLPFDEDAARKSVALERTLARKGQLIGRLDIFIAATCLTHNLALLTLDRDFAMVDGLRLVEI